MGLKHLWFDGANTAIFGRNCQKPGDGIETLQAGIDRTLVYRRNCQKPGDGIETAISAMNSTDMTFVGIVRSPVMGLKRTIWQCRQKFL